MAKAYFWYTQKAVLPEATKIDWCWDSSYNGSKSHLHHQLTYLLSPCSVTELNIRAILPFSRCVQPDCLADTCLGFLTSLCPVENHGGGKHTLFSFKFSFPRECEPHLWCHNVGGAGVTSSQAAVLYLDKCYIHQECWQGRERENPKIMGSKLQTTEYVFSIHCFIYFAC